MFEALSHAKELLGDKGYDSDWFRAALTARGITPCILPKSIRNVQYHYDKDVYKKRHPVGNAFAKIKDWRRIHSRSDRSAYALSFKQSVSLPLSYLGSINEP